MAMQSIVEKIFEHIREIDAGLNVGGVEELEKMSVEAVEGISLALGHLNDRVAGVLRRVRYPMHYRESPGARESHRGGNGKA